MAFHSALDCRLSNIRGREGGRRKREERREKREAN